MLRHYLAVLLLLLVGTAAGSRWQALAGSSSPRASSSWGTLRKACALSWTAKPSKLLGNNSAWAGSRTGAGVLTGVRSL